MIKVQIEMMNIFIDLQMLTLIILILITFNSIYASTCNYNTKVGNKLYSYSLVSPIKDYPHGILSEDGFYKVVANDTIIWFQLCDVLIFNHDPPKCIDCWDCGGPSRCGMGCSALVAEKTGGYHVCTTIGRDLNFKIELTDRKTPNMGVTVLMSSMANGVNCSLSVSIICDSNGVKEPESFNKTGTCNYTTVLRHPSGCSKIAVHGGKWGWFGVLLTILLCGLGAYLVVGVGYRFFFLGIHGLHFWTQSSIWVQNLKLLCGLGAYLVVGVGYRFFFLGIHGLHAIPNLDFWASIPHRTKSLFMSLVQRIRGPTYHHTSSYSSVNF